MKKIISIVLAALALAACKQGIPDFQQPGLAPLGDIRAFYIELGHNMWCDYPTPAMLKGRTMEEACALLPEKRRPDLVLRCKDEYWRQVTDYAAEKGINLLVVDLGEGLRFPSHPELSIEGSWSVEKMQDEIRRLNALGVEVVPKLNFSTCHNGWLGKYRTAVSTEIYYKVCEDLIADCCEIFGHPRFFHIGYDEENNDLLKKYSYKCERTGEVWWQDFLHIVKTVESHGCRAWMWSDYAWLHPDEFCERCPKSVIQQNWYYDDHGYGFEVTDPDNADAYQLEISYKFKENGFDQVPCSSNWLHPIRASKGMNGDDIIGRFVKVFRRDITDEHLYGFMMAPWFPCDNEENVRLQLRAIDLFTEALYLKKP